MSTFEATRMQRVQRHFEVLEIDLPVITGTCTLNGSDGTGTPLTCDEAWTGEYKTYYFTNENAPILPAIGGEPIYRLIKSISENATELKVGDGLASRSSLTVVLNDITKQDPNSYAPGVTGTVKNQGTYLGKLAARQIMPNKQARLKLYRVEDDGTIDLTNGAETRNYLTSDLSLTSKGTWILSCKDALSIVNIDEKVWPIERDGFLREDITLGQLDIPVDSDTDYSGAEVVRIGDEFLSVASVSGNLTSSAELTVNVRGINIVGTVSGELLTSTVNDEHSAGDEVFICDVSDNETIDSLLTRVLTDSGLDSALIPAGDWSDEVAEWHANDKINTIHSESEGVNDVINRILTGYLMDLWYSVTDNEVKLSAISVWKQSTSTLLEGKEINAFSIKKTAKETLRATRALVAYDKRNKAATDGYSKGARFSDDTLISDALYTEHKDKQFDDNFLLDKDAADLLVQRYVSRFKFTPFERHFITDERYLTFKTGDVVDLTTSVDQDIYGLSSGNIRAQITKINPKYNEGRTYDVRAMTYEAAFSGGSEIVLDGVLSDINFYVLAGAPSEAIELTFVLTGSHCYGDIAMRAGGFASGSKLIIIMVNGFQGQANGGNGGAPDQYYSASTPAEDGGDGGVVYDANGVDTDIYFSGATPSTAYPTADGYILAPGGGGGGSGYEAATADSFFGAGGGGGAGIISGQGFLSASPDFNSGISGLSTGTGGLGGEYDDAYYAGDGGDWGMPGTAGDNNSTSGGAGGAAGSGVLDSTATVTFYGDSVSRYINGNGDH